MSVISGYNQVAREDNIQSMIGDNTTLVKKIAYHLHARLPSHIQIDDLIQSGSVGLIEAAKKFKTDMGTSFKTFASIRIRGAMIDYLRAYTEIPRAIYQSSQRIAKAIEECEKQTGEDTNAEDIAQKLGVSLDEYHHMLTQTSSCYLISLDELEHEEEMTAYSNYYNPLYYIEASDFAQKIAHLISQLPQNEQTILALYNNEELTFKEIGYVLDISESRACQLYSQAIKRLRSRINKQLQM